MRDKLRKKARLFYLLAAAIAFVIGGGVAYIGNEAGNPLIIIVGFAGLVGGVLLLRQWREVKEARVLGKVVEKPNCRVLLLRQWREVKEARVLGKVVEKPNCLTISESHIEFIHVAKEEELKGLSQKCYNDGNYYHVHKINNGEGSEHFQLPDDDENERFYDPAEMANVVTMPSNKKYFTWSASLMQTIKIGLMVVVVCAEVIGLVALGG